MGPTKAELIVILRISAILALESATVSSAVEDLMVVQCKHNCKHGLQNQKECEDQCNEKIMMQMKKETHRRQEEKQDPFCQAFCKHILEDGEEVYQHCMTVCPRTKSIPKMTAIERSSISKTVDNEAVCETTCTVLREKPLSIECIRVCHERIPGAVDAST